MRKTGRVADMDMRVQLGRLIKARRLALGYDSQQSLADAGGPSVRMIAAAEGGERVGPKTLRRLEQVLQLESGSLDALLSGKLDQLVPATVVTPEPATDQNPSEVMQKAVADLIRVLGEEETKRYLSSLVERSAQQDTSRDRAAGE